ncbi:hypothetical protein TNCV_4894141 [Trichonephila clavipes]|nr:hypothetical protein TNCV_4894141 [Trichonephila clavipes]
MGQDKQVESNHVVHGESVEDDKRSGHPQTSLFAENIENVSAAELKNRLQTAESAGISSITCQWILSKDINMHRTGRHIVSRMLNNDQSADEVNSESQAELKDMTKNEFHKYFKDLYKRRRITSTILIKSPISKVDVFQQSNG